MSFCLSPSCAAIMTNVCLRSRRSAKPPASRRRPSSSPLSPCVHVPGLKGKHMVGITLPNYIRSAHTEYPSDLDDFHSPVYSSTFDFTHSSSSITSQHGRSIAKGLCGSRRRRSCVANLTVRTIHYLSQGDEVSWNWGGGQPCETI